jgi:protein-L-isoaspartate(D-aspartate) O-methyltransferase
MLELAAQRGRMVDRQLARRGIDDPKVLKAMREVPREAFVCEDLREFAYDDRSLPIEAGQSISQPYIVGLMIQAAAIQLGDRVLEIGAGSGYAAAVISRIATQVFAIERHGDLAGLAARRLARLGYNNVEVRTSDGSLGWAEAARYDAILVAACGPSLPQALQDQLQIGGCLIMPMGESNDTQRLIKMTRVSESHFKEEDLGGVVFVPLVGAHGWTEVEALGR